MYYSRQKPGGGSGGGGASTSPAPSFSATLKPNISMDKGLTSLLSKKEKESYNADEAPPTKVGDSMVNSLFSSTSSTSRYSSSRGGKKGKLR